MVSPVEIGVVAGALFLFFFLPGILVSLESLERRRARFAAPSPRGADVAVSFPAAAEPAEESAETGHRHTEAVAAYSEVVITTLETVESLAEPAMEKPVEVPAPLPDEGPHSFRLDDLRYARILETPPREVLDDPAGQQQWEDGLRLAERHGAAIGGASLSASFEPQARCFAGVRDLGETKELHFFLFPGLWPTSLDQAAGEAVFEVTGAGLVKAYVVRR